MPRSVGPIDKVREELRRVGTRRKVQERADKKLARDTGRALKKAKGKVPVTEAAKLAGVSRSTAYDVYLKS